MNKEDIENHWKQALTGDAISFNQLKQFYMSKLLRIKPVYTQLEDDTFYHILDQSVTKALERGLKFQVIDYEAYMDMASQTYFKSFFLPDNESFNIPIDLIRAYSKLDEVYRHIPELPQKDENQQIEILASSFEYPSFPTRLLFYSFKKWKENALRQVDIDLTVNLLPAPQRVEWEIFNEKKTIDIEKAIMKQLKNKALL